MIQDEEEEEDQQNTTGELNAWCHVLKSKMQNRTRTD